MKYKLLENAQIGVIIDVTPVMQDFKDTFKVSFLLPYDGTYIAIFRDAHGVEYKAIIHNAVAVVPKDIIVKEQLVGLTVCLVDGEQILYSWECQPLRISSFLNMRKNQRQLAAGMTDEKLYQRIAELEQGYADFKATCDSLADQVRACVQSQTAMTQLISALSERVNSAESKAMSASNEVAQIYLALEQ